MNRRTKPKPNQVDHITGQNLKRFRVAQGMTQVELAKHTNMSFQQIQKYESAANRIAASRLYVFSCVLDVPITDFFDHSKSACQAYRLTRQDYALINTINNLSNKKIKNALKMLIRNIGQPKS